MSAQARYPVLRRLAVLALILVPTAAAAQASEFLGAHRDWSVYAFNEGDRRICYVASEPRRQEGNYARRGDPAVLVTRRPGPQAVDEVSVQPGYSYLEGSEVEVTVDQQTFELFTQGQHAWAKTEEADRALIEAMRRGVEMTVRGTSTRKTFSLDTYSLLGFTAAYNAMADACPGQS